VGAVPDRIEIGEIAMRDKAQCSSIHDVNPYLIGRSKPRHVCSLATAKAPRATRIHDDGRSRPTRECLPIGMFTANLPGGRGTSRTRRLLGAYITGEIDGRASAGFAVTAREQRPARRIPAGL
jgi:hypothetical protein